MMPTGVYVRSEEHNKKIVKQGKNIMSLFGVLKREKMSIFFVYIVLFSLERSLGKMVERSVL